MADPPAPLGIPPQGIPPTAGTAYADLIAKGRLEPLKVWDVRDFGAIGDGSHNDQPAIQRAFDRASLQKFGPNANNTIYFPPGKYKCQDKVSYNASPRINLLGMGRQVSQVTFATPNGGFDITYTAHDRRIEVAGLSLLAEQAAAGTALKVTWPAMAGSTLGHALIHDLEISNVNVTDHYWNSGIVLNDGLMSIIRDCWIRGKQSYRTSSVGINLTGDCTGARIENVFIFFFGIGIDVPGTSEGVIVGDSSLVIVNIGIRSLAGVLEPSFIIHGVHINAYVRGIQLQNRNQSNIHHNVIYKRADSTDAFTGIALDPGCHQTKINDNSVLILTGATGGEVAYVYEALEGHIHDNYGKDMSGALVWLKSTSDDCVVHDNLRNGGTTTVVNDGGTPAANIHDNFNV